MVNLGWFFLSKPLLPDGPTDTEINSKLETIEQEVIYKVTRSEILMGRDAEFPLTEELESNLTKLLAAVNKLRDVYGKPMIVSSGYRPGHYNTKAGGAKTSAHLSCEAVDFRDADGQLKNFCTEEVLAECGLYMESPDHTPTWCHLQIRTTKKRTFNP